MAVSSVCLPEMRFIACPSMYSASVIVRVAIVKKAVRQGRTPGTCYGNGAKKGGYGFMVC